MVWLFEEVQFVFFNLEGLILHKLYYICPIQSHRGEGISDSGMTPLSYGAITRPAFARKFQAEVDEHKENLAKGGFVPPVRAAVQNAALMDRKYEEMTDEPAPKLWGY